MKLFKKIKFQKDGKIIKKYKLFGVSVLRKEILPFKRKWNLLGIKFCRKYKKIQYGFRSIFNKENEKLNKLNFVSVKQGVISIDTIKQIISSNDVDVISFDIFDTLLVRPVIFPTDIFYLIDKKLKKENGIDFIKYRLLAEKELNNPFANIDDIYNHIQKKYNISEDNICLMKNEELKCEEQLLTKRTDIFEIYLYAVKLNKKIIVTSDMYLSSKFLKKVLVKNGYTHIDKVYVSNEYKSRKDEGSLYDIVKKEENTVKIVHIGDNYESDYKKALEANITPIYYPSIKNIVFSDETIYSQIFSREVSSDPMCRILLGFTLNEYFKNLNNVKEYRSIFADFESMVKLSIAPLIFYISNSIANNDDIQNNYEQILFASRDGYLPKIGYDIIAKYRKIKPSKYVYAGRRAYFSSQYNSFFDYLSEMKVNPNCLFTVKDILKIYEFDNNIVDVILSQLSEDENKLNFNKNKEEIISVLYKHKELLEKSFEGHREESIQYYNGLISKSEKEIIFDCGYSGSISQALSKITGKVFDKIYLWETEKNRELDRKNGSKTILLMNEGKSFCSQHLIYEELFSPLEGGCLGFISSKPILENCFYNDKMINEYRCIYDVIHDYMNNICNLFGSFLEFLLISDTETLQKMLVKSITYSQFNELLLLENIKHPDTIFEAKVKSLSYKVQEWLSWKNPFDRTGFENPNNKVKAPIILMENNFKIGIHIHLYYIDLGYEFLDYLKDFPQKFDLIITICDNDKVSIVRNIFSNTIPNLEKLIVKVVENRGRDIAPWLISTRNEQKEYDLFCHIQSKVSKYIGFGDKWRCYLLDNLLYKDVVFNILNLFSQNKELGCVFPEPFRMLKEICVSNNINQIGEFGEEVQINDLLQKMGFDYYISHNDLFFSEGSMMWYRPKALQSLFDLNLSLEDFPSEPIGVGGTIAHAIERLPALVCKLNGYEAREYTYKS